MNLKKLVKNRDSMTKKTLVIIACYNGRKYIIEQINSILNQINIDVTILIQDDKSKDSTYELLESVYKDNTKVILRRANSNSGSASRNFISIFRNCNFYNYDYYCLCDQDDIWYPDKLNRAITIIDEKNVAGYSAAVNAFWPDGKSKILTQSQNIRLSDYIFEGAGQGCTFVLNGDFFQKIKLFCDAHSDLCFKFHFHDWLIYILSRAWNYRWYFDQNPCMDYRQHANNDIGSKGTIQAIIKRFSLIKNGWYKNQVLIAIQIYKLAGGSDPLIFTFNSYLNSKKYLSRRLYLSYLIFRYGRRRFGDRCILFLSACIGWL
jgi:rhamnosyltransferase